METDDGGYSFVDLESFWNRALRVFTDDDERGYEVYIRRVCKYFEKVMEVMDRRMYEYLVGSVVEPFSLFLVREWEGGGGGVFLVVEDAMKVVARFCCRFLEYRECLDCIGMMMNCKKDECGGRMVMNEGGLDGNVIVTQFEVLESLIDLDLPELNVLVSVKDQILNTGYDDDDGENVGSIGDGRAKVSPKIFLGDIVMKSSMMAWEKNDLNLERWKSQWRAYEQRVLRDDFGDFSAMLAVSLSLSLIEQNDKNNQRPISPLTNDISSMIRNKHSGNDYRDIWLGDAVSINTCKNDIVRIFVENYCFDTIFCALSSVRFTPLVVWIVSLMNLMMKMGSHFDNYAMQALCVHLFNSLEFQIPRMEMDNFKVEKRNNDSWKQLIECCSKLFSDFCGNRTNSNLGDGVVAGRGSEALIIANKYVEIIRLKIALSFLKCPYLERRLSGLNDLIDQTNKVLEFSMTHDIFLEEMQNFSLYDQMEFLDALRRENMNSTDKGMTDMEGAQNGGGDFHDGWVDDSKHDDDDDDCTSDTGNTNKYKRMRRLKSVDFNNSLGSFRSVFLGPEIRQSNIVNKYVKTSVIDLDLLRNKIKHTINLKLNHFLNAAKTTCSNIDKTKLMNQFFLGSLKWLTGQRLAAWLLRNKIVEELFGEKMHTTLVSRCPKIIMFLSYYSCLNCDHIRLIWDCQQEKHETITHLIWRTITEFVHSFSWPLLNCLLEFLKIIPIQKYSTETVNLLKSVVDASIGRHLVDRKMAEENEIIVRHLSGDENHHYKLDSNVNSRPSNDCYPLSPTQIITLDDSQFDLSKSYRPPWNHLLIFLDIIFNPSTPNHVLVESAYSLDQFLSSKICYEHRLFFITRCIDSIRNGTHVYQSIKLILMILNTYEDFNNNNDYDLEKSKITSFYNENQLKLPSVVDFLVHHFNLIDLLFDNLARYKILTQKKKKKCVQLLLSERLRGSLDDAVGNWPVTESFADDVDFQNGLPSGKSYNQLIFKKLSSLHDEKDGRFFLDTFESVCKSEVSFQTSTIIPMAPTFREIVYEREIDIFNVWNMICFDQTSDYGHMEQISCRLNFLDILFRNSIVTAISKQKIDSFWTSIMDNYLTQQEYDLGFAWIYQINKKCGTSYMQAILDQACYIFQHKFYTLEWTKVSSIGWDTIQYYFIYINWSKGYLIWKDNNYYIKDIVNLIGLDILWTLLLLVDCPDLSLNVSSFLKKVYSSPLNTLSIPEISKFNYECIGITMKYIQYAHAIYNDHHRHFDLNSPTFDKNGDTYKNFVAKFPFHPIFYPYIEDDRHKYLLRIFKRSLSLIQQLKQSVTTTPSPKTTIVSPTHDYNLKVFVRSLDDSFDEFSLNITSDLPINILVSQMSSQIESSITHRHHQQYRTHQLNNYEFWCLDHELLNTSTNTIGSHISTIRSTTTTTTTTQQQQQPLNSLIIEAKKKSSNYKKNISNNSEINYEDGMKTINEYTTPTMILFQDYYEQFYSLLEVDIDPNFTQQLWSMIQSLPTPKELKDRVRALDSGDLDVLLPSNHIFRILKFLQMLETRLDFTQSVDANGEPEVMETEDNRIVINQLVSNGYVNRMVELIFSIDWMELKTFGTIPIICLSTLIGMLNLIMVRRLGIHVDMGNNDHEAANHFFTLYTMNEEVLDQIFHFSDCIGDITTRLITILIQVIASRKSGSNDSKLLNSLITNINKYNPFVNFDFYSKSYHPPSIECHPCEILMSQTFPFILAIVNYQFSKCATADLQVHINNTIHFTTLEPFQTLIQLSYFNQSSAQTRILTGKFILDLTNQFLSPSTIPSHFTINIDCYKKSLVLPCQILLRNLFFLFGENFLINDANIQPPDDEDGGLDRHKASISPVIEYFYTICALLNRICIDRKDDQVPAMINEHFRQLVYRLWVENIELVGRILHSEKNDPILSTTTNWALVGSFTLLKTIVDNYNILLSWDGASARKKDNVDQYTTILDEQVGRLSSFVCSFLFKLVFDEYRGVFYSRLSTANRKPAYQLFLSLYHLKVSNSIYFQLKILKEDILSFLSIPRSKNTTFYNKSEGMEKSTTGHVGLLNLSATCYMNSLLQQLYMIPQFRYGLMSINSTATANDEFVILNNYYSNQNDLNYNNENYFNTNTDDGGKCFSESTMNESNSVLCQLQSIFSNLHESQRQFFDPIEFTRVFKFEGEPMNPRMQMDADEFYVRLLDILEPSIKCSNMPNLLEDVFGGSIIQQIKSSCMHSSEKEEQFLTLPLDVKGKKSIVDSLNLFIQIDTLDGDNKYKCEQCGKLVDAKKRCMIGKCPKNLVIHLKRFDYDFDEMEMFRRIKINDFYDFPINLDLKDYTKWGIEDTTDSVDDYYQSKYKISGIIVHHGSVDRGHYYSFIRERFCQKTYTSISSDKRDIWYSFEDNVVKFLDPEKIPDQCFGGVVNNNNSSLLKNYNAYLLFYTRMDQLEYCPPQIALPKQLFNSIWADNVSLLRDRAAFNSDFHEFIYSLLHSSIQHINCHRPYHFGNSSILIEKFLIILIRTFCYYVFQIISYGTFAVIGTKTATTSAMDTGNDISSNIGDNAIRDKNEWIMKFKPLIRSVLKDYSVLPCIEFLNNFCRLNCKSINNNCSDGSSLFMSLINRQKELRSMVFEFTNLSLKRCLEEEKNWRNFVDVEFQQEICEFLEIKNSSFNTQFDLLTAYLESKEILRNRCNQPHAIVSTDINPIDCNQLITHIINSSVSLSFVINVICNLNFDSIQKSLYTEFFSIIRLICGNEFCAPFLLLVNLIVKLIEYYKKVYARLMQKHVKSNNIPDVLEDLVAAIYFLAKRIYFESPKIKIDTESGDNGILSNYFGILNESWFKLSDPGFWCILISNHVSFPMLHEFIEYLTMRDVWKWYFYHLSKCHFVQLDSSLFSDYRHYYLNYCGTGDVYAKNQPSCNFSIFENSHRHHRNAENNGSSSLHVWILFNRILIAIFKWKRNCLTTINYFNFDYMGDTIGQTWELWTGIANSNNLKIFINYNNFPYTIEYKVEALNGNEDHFIRDIANYYLRFIDDDVKDNDTKSLVAREIAYMCEENVIFKTVLFTNKSLLVNKLLFNRKGIVREEVEKILLSLVVPEWGDTLERLFLELKGFIENEKGEEGAFFDCYTIIANIYVHFIRMKRYNCGGKITSDSKSDNDIVLYQHYHYSIGNSAFLRDLDQFFHDFYYQMKKNFFEFLKNMIESNRFMHSWYVMMVMSREESLHMEPESYSSNIRLIIEKTNAIFEAMIVQQSNRLDAIYSDLSDVFEQIKHVEWLQMILSENCNTGDNAFEFVFCSQFRIINWILSTCNGDYSKKLQVQFLEDVRSYEFILTIYVNINQYNLLFNSNTDQIIKFLLFMNYKVEKISLITIKLLPNIMGNNMSMESYRDKMARCRLESVFYFYKLVYWLLEVHMRYQINDLINQNDGNERNDILNYPSRIYSHNYFVWCINTFLCNLNCNCAKLFNIISKMTFLAICSMNEEWIKTYTNILLSNIRTSNHHYPHYRHQHQHLKIIRNLLRSLAIPLISHLCLTHFRLLHYYPQHSHPLLTSSSSSAFSSNIEFSNTFFSIYNEGKFLLYDNNGSFNICNVGMEIVKNEEDLCDNNSNLNESASLVAECYKNSFIRKNDNYNSDYFNLVNCIDVERCDLPVMTSFRVPNDLLDSSMKLLLYSMIFFNCYGFMNLNVNIIFSDFSLKFCNNNNSLPALQNIENLPSLNCNLYRFFDRYYQLVSLAVIEKSSNSKDFNKILNSINHRDFDLANTQEMKDNCKLASLCVLESLYIIRDNLKWIPSCLLLKLSKENPLGMFRNYIFIQPSSSSIVDNNFVYFNINSDFINKNSNYNEDRFIYNETILKNSPPRLHLIQYLIPFMCNFHGNVELFNSFLTITRQIPELWKNMNNLATILWCVEHTYSLELEFVDIIQDIILYFCMIDLNIFKRIIQLYSLCYGTTSKTFAYSISNMRPNFSHYEFSQFSLIVEFFFISWENSKINFLESWIIDLGHSLINSLLYTVNRSNPSSMSIDQNMKIPFLIISRLFLIVLKNDSLKSIANHLIRISDQENVSQLILDIWDMASNTQFDKDPQSRIQIETVKNLWKKN